MTSIRPLSDSDQPAAEAFLSRHPESSMFLRGNMRLAGITYKDADYHGSYIGAFDEDSGLLTGLLAHYWNGNIMMQAPDHDILRALVQSYRMICERPVQGILGDDAQAQIVMQELQITNLPFAVNNAEGLYALALTDLNLPEKAEAPHLSIRLTQDADSAVLTDWLTAYEIEALGAEDNEALAVHVKDRVRRTIGAADSWILCDNDTPVALCGFNARLPDIVQIGPVWTPPAHRNNGYARIIVAKALQGAANENVEKSVLFTDNPAAAKAYEAVGFQKIGAYRLALLKEPQHIKPPR